MSIKPLLSSILLVVLVGCVGCNREDDGYGWGDPLPIPEHPAFIWNSGPDANTITILDLDKEEIVGRRQVLPRRYVSYDFAVYGKSTLLFPIDYFDIPVELGDEVIIVDPSLQEQKVGTISTYPSPASIDPIRGNKSILAHAFRSHSDSLWTTTLMDMQERTVLAEFKLQNAIEGVLEFPDGSVYLFYRGWGASTRQFMREFYPSSNSLGEEVELPNIDFAPHSLIPIEDGLACAFADWVENERSYTTIEIIQIPSCSTVVSIPLTEKFPDRMAYVKGKLYVCHNNGEVMEYGNLNKVSVVDLESRSVIKVIDVCNGPCDIAYSAATDKIVVISLVGTVITIIDPVTDSVINTIVSDEVGDVDDEWGYDRLRIPE